MLLTDTYKSVGKPASGEYKDKGSKFIGYVFQVTDEEQCKTIVQQLKKEHPNAAHHCYAYVIGYNQHIQKFNDDHEPANTAGRPILRSILSRSLTQTLIVVVRYFGGKLLGVPGLINAYEQAANSALDATNIVELIIHEEFEITVSYEFENDVFRIVKQFQLKVLSHVHADDIKIRVEVRKSKADAFLDAIRLNHHLQVKFIAER